MRTVIKGLTAARQEREILVNDDGSLAVGLTVDGADITLGTVGIDQVTPDANKVVVESSALPTGAASESTLAAIETLLADPATSAKQDTGNTSLATIASGMATQTTLAAILAKIIAAPATEATLAALNAKVTAINTGATVIASGTVTANAATATLANSTAYEASRVVKASAGTLLSLTGYNSGPAQFIQIFNSTTVPANGTAPVLLISVPATSSFAFEWRNGIPLSTGIAVSNSSTGATKTIGSADCFFTATYL